MNVDNLMLADVRTASIMHAFSLPPEMSHADRPRILRSSSVTQEAFQLLVGLRSFMQPCQFFNAPYLKDERSGVDWAYEESFGIFT